MRGQVYNSQKYWEDLGIEFRIQDFKGEGGIYNTESVKYTAEDWELIYPEYCHGGKDCCCRDGHKQVLIRGYDTMGGDVLACWQDHKVIGNIVDDWYEPYNNVAMDNSMPRGRRVEGGMDYRTDYMHDVDISAREQNHYNNNQRRYWMLARLEVQRDDLLTNIRELQHANTQDKITREQLLAQVANADHRIAERDKTLIALDGGLHINAQAIEWAKEPEARVS